MTMGTGWSCTRSEDRSHVDDLPTFDNRPAYGRVSPPRGARPAPQYSPRSPYHSDASHSDHEDSYSYSSDFSGRSRLYSPRSMSRSVSRSVSRSGSRSRSRSPYNSLSRSHSRSITPSVSRSRSRSFSHSVSRTRSISRSRSPLDHSRSASPIGGERDVSRTEGKKIQPVTEGVVVETAPTASPPPAAGGWTPPNWADMQTAVVSAAVGAAVTAFRKGEYDGRERGPPSVELSARKDILYTDPAPERERVREDVGREAMGGSGRSPLKASFGAAERERERQMERERERAMPRGGDPEVALERERSMRLAAEERADIADRKLDEMSQRLQSISQAMERLQDAEKKGQGASSDGGDLRLLDDIKGLKERIKVMQVKDDQSQKTITRQEAQVKEVQKKLDRKADELDAMRAELDRAKDSRKSVEDKMAADRRLSEREVKQCQRENQQALKREADAVARADK
ncbi:hypothetical protein KIPB_004436, partial [Kipferlia bialata]|eukprot:g4436.t1